MPRDGDEVWAHFTEHKTGAPEDPKKTMHDKYNGGCNEATMSSGGVAQFLLTPACGACSRRRICGTDARGEERAGEGRRHISRGTAFSCRRRLQMSERRLAARPPAVYGGRPGARGHVRTWTDSH